MDGDVKFWSLHFDKEAEDYSPPRLISAFQLQLKFNTIYL